MNLFRRRKSQETDPADGVIVMTPGHRCQPPGAEEWPAGEWKVTNGKKYPEDTVWRCPCGKAWRSGRYPPRFGARSYSNGLWLNWYEDPEHDAEVSDGGDHAATD